MTAWAPKLLVALLAAGSMSAAAPDLQAGESAKPPQGGMFRIVYAQPEPLDTMDPAMANTQAAWALLDLTCARLMNYPDKSGRAAFEPVPEVAAAPPRISRDGRTYTFTLRRRSASATTSRSMPAPSRRRSTAPSPRA